MRTSTATTPTAAGAMPAALIADESPAYRYAGHGAFLPANAAAVKECDDWNTYAALITVRSAATRSAVQ